MMGNQGSALNTNSAPGPEASTSHHRSWVELPRSSPAACAADSSSFPASPLLSATQPVPAAPCFTLEI